MPLRRLAAVQAHLQAERVDGWLLYDFHNINPIARRLAGIPTDRILTRRWACFIPATGEPRWLIHAIEAGSLQDIVPHPETYVSWQEWQEGLRRVLGDARRVAMEYAPGNAIPAVSRVDAGTVELVRSLGVDILSSADLVQVAEAVWTPAQVESHRRTAKALIAIKDLAFAFISERLHSAQPATETEVQALIMRLFRERDLITDHPPIVAVNEHAADPHFVPRKQTDKPMREGDVILIDLWAKERGEDAVYADITWMAYIGHTPPPRLQHVFHVVRQARDAAVALVQERVQNRTPVYGYEVDDAARTVIQEAGLAEYFIHRTGHSLGTDVHGNGVNMDNLETRDTRRIIPGIAFTVEPGIYLPREGFGIRLEIDCYVSEDQVEVTTLPLQEDWVCLH